MSTPEQQIQAVDWAIAQNADKESPFYKRVDVDAIAAAGMSCGGLQTLHNSEDPRFKTLMIMNSGLFINPGAAMPNIKKETFKNLVLSIDDDKNVQKSVVSSLDSIQTAIDSKKMQLLSLDELVKSRFISQEVA
jgi:restriction endonuclease S subunit